MFKSAPEPTPKLALPIHEATTFVLVRPHYPENVGAAARAIKTMGFLKLALVRPGRLATPEHEMAQKMAVKSRGVLAAAVRHDSLDAALTESDFVLCTTSRRGVSGILGPRQAAARAVSAATSGARITVLFGNEKTGLDRTEVPRADAWVRIPMAADQPSINLAQAVQLVAYEFLMAALEARESGAAPKDDEC